MSRLLIKKISYLVLISVFSLPMLTCGVQSLINKPTSYVKQPFRPGDKIAVLTFEQSSGIGQKNLGAIVADRVSEQFFIEKKLQVSDRSFVKKMIDRNNIKSTESLNITELKNLNRELNAKYVICGKVEVFRSSQYFDPEEEFSVVVTIRALDAISGDLTALARMESKGRDVTAVSTELVESIITKIDWVESLPVVQADSLK